MKSDERFRVTENDHLVLREVDLVDLSEEFGTPLFVFDERRLRDNYREFLNIFQKNYQKTIVCYSIKTSYNLRLCKIMSEEGAHAEVCSGLDLYVAKTAGFQADHIIFDGLYKSERSLREAIRDRVLLINVESFPELGLVDRIAGEMGFKQTVGIRINLFRKKVSLESMYSSLYGHPNSRFGFSLENAYSAFSRASELENVEVKGILTHPFYQATASLPSLLSFIKRIQNELKIDLQYINFGGGFRSNYSISPFDLAKDYLRQKIGLESKLDEKKSVNIEETSRLIGEAIKKLPIDKLEPTIIFEPGHYIVNDAGLLLLRVGYIKESSQCKWIIVDGGTNLIPFYQERREITIANRARDHPAETVNVVGPMLYANDFITIKKRLPRIKEGDILAIHDAGAYTISLSNQFLYPRPPIILLDNKGTIKEIRDEETYDDVLCMDK